MNTALLFFAILLATELIRRRLKLPFRWHGSTMLLAIALLCTTLYSLHFVRVQSRRDAAINQRQEETQSQLDRAASFLKEGLSVHPHDGIRFLDREGRALDAFKFFTYGPSGTARTPQASTTAGGSPITSLASRRQSGELFKAKSKTDGA